MNVNRAGNFNTYFILHLSRAVKKIWVHLDGNIDDEVVGVNGSRGLDFDDQNVVAARPIIISRKINYSRMASLPMKLLCR